MRIIVPCAVANIETVDFGPICHSYLVFSVSNMDPTNFLSYVLGVDHGDGEEWRLEAAADCRQRDRHQTGEWSITYFQIS